MIEFDHVSFEYEKGKAVIDDMSFRIDKGESVGLIGANGAGKSTIMKLLLGLATGEGRISIDGIEVNPENLSKIRKKMGFVLQNSDNQMFMPTVYEDMMFATSELHGFERGCREESGRGAQDRLDLEELKYKYNHKISGGEKRMAAIATILAMEPEVILMDEPTSALDPYNRRIVINTIKGLEQTKIITSHDLDMILDTCERVILISKGRVVADGPANEILSDEALLERHRMELPLGKQ